MARVPHVAEKERYIDVRKSAPGISPEETGSKE